MCVGGGGGGGGGRREGVKLKERERVRKLYLRFLYLLKKFDVEVLMK